MQERSNEFGASLSIVMVYFAWNPKACKDYSYEQTPVCLTTDNYNSKVQKVSIYSINSNLILFVVHLIPHTSTIQGRIKGVLHFIPGTYQHTSGSHALPVYL